MSKFKKGDRIRCLTTHTRYGQRQGWTKQYASFLNGTEGVITGKGNGALGVEIQMPEESFYLDTYDMEHSELVNSEEQENKMKFDLKTQPWFINVSNIEQSRAVQQWLFDQGLSWCTGSKKLNNLEIGCITNFLDWSGNSVVEESGFMHSSYNRIHSGKGEKEIKLNFKTIIDSVEWPEMETEAQKELRKLQEQIEVLQAQANVLKETMK